LAENNQRILMGNEAIGRGIVEAGVSLAASYPGPRFDLEFPPFFKGGIKGGLLGAPLQ
jgi:hypothetical protein